MPQPAIAGCGIAAFIVFMLQNTGPVHVTFLSMPASLPLVPAPQRTSIAATCP